MKCHICKIKQARKNSTVCSSRCDALWRAIFKLQNLVTPTNGCDNCWGDLHQGCTEQCREEFRKSHAFGKELWKLVREHYKPE